MIKTLSIKRLIWRSLVILLLAAVTVSAKASAQSISTEDLLRTDMLQIAEAYATYRWQASELNIAHDNTNHKHTPDAMTNYLDLNAHPIYDTSVIPERPVGHDGWWLTGNNINEGVPYFWGGSIAIRNNDLNPEANFGLAPIYFNGLYFDQMLVAGDYAAGDVTTETHQEPKKDSQGDPILVDGKPIMETKQDFSSDPVGVDCVGLINQVWKIPTRAGMSATRHGTLPIQLQTLKRGDILMKYEQSGPDDKTASHVVLFEEFVLDEPGITKVKVYESSVGYGRVTESIWKIWSFVPYEDPWYPDSPTHKVKMERVQVKLDGIWVDADHWIQDGYVPRTVFQPRDIVIVIDRSTSLSELQLGRATEATEMFIRTMRTGDRIGIVAFAGNASQIFPPPGNNLTYGEIDSAGTVKTAAISALANISSGSGTSIGGGLRLGQQLLNTPDSDDRMQFMILMSDGEENSYPTWDNVKPGGNVQPNITTRVTAMSIGSSATGYQLMSRIAKETNGIWFPGATVDWMTNIMQSIAPGTYREKIFKLVKRTASLGGTTEDTAFVDSTVASVTFSLAWPGSDLDMTLVQPDGTIIGPAVADADPNIEFVSGATYEYYKIFAPQKGTWTVRVFGKSMSGLQEDYSMVVSGADAMNLSVDPDRDEYLTGDPIKITASIEDSVSDSPIGPEYIHGVAMQVTANNPNSTQSSFELYDDGLHGDGGENDGVYANTFSATAFEGNYDFDVRISGNTNRDGQPFTREKPLSIFVIKPPTVVSSLRASPNPTNYYNVDYAVTFSESVTGVDMSDFALTTVGVSGAAVSTIIAVNPVTVYIGDFAVNYASVYTVTINTGSGNGMLRLDVIDNDTITDRDGNRLGGTGIGNGNFTTGETYNIDKTIISTIVTKPADTNDGFCNADCSLHEAIETAAPGNTVTFDAALSNQTIHLASTLTLSKNVTIDGSALAIPITISGDTNADGIGDVRVFNVNNYQVVVTLRSLTISKGYAPEGGNLYNGGGIDNAGTLIVTNSTFLNNSAFFSGGGIHNRGNLTVINSTFSGNSSGSSSSYGSGGGIWGASGSVTVINSTFSGNSSTNGIGGGIGTYGGQLNIYNSTLSGNSATPWGGGGIAVRTYGRLIYANTIIANSIGGDCAIVSGSLLITNTKNLVEDGSCSAQLSGDPNLSLLANNGGTIQTIALLAGSSAIDAGDDAVCAAAPVNNLDQRGIARPQGLHCDIGAFEYVQVTNVAPVVNAGNDVALNEGNQFTRSVVFSDPDSTQWQLAIDYGDGTSPINTTLNAQGDINLDHVYADDGIYTLSVALTDNAGASTTDTIAVTVQNVVPLVNGDADQTVNVGSSISVSVLYSDVGILDTHSATINWGDGNTETVPVNVTSPGNGTVSGQHVYSASGNFTVEVCVADNAGGVGCDTVNIVVNSFPSTPVLDNFNRANGSIGSNWSGYTAKYHITSNQMTVDYNGSNSDIYWNNLFGADQEAYVTFTDIDSTASEQDLLLKAQSNTTWGDGVLEVLYDPTGQLVQVWTYEWPDGWIQHGADIPVTFVDGDIFGARALANGTVEVYKNGTLLSTRDITSWSHYADGGYIGLWFIGAEDAVLDDFGGGTISGGTAPMSMSGGSTESKNLTPAQLDVNLQDAVAFWQGISIGSNQPANVTFTNIPANKQNLLLKPQSNGMWGEGVVEVLYDVAGQRIQLWMYDSQTGNGWVQYGKDIPVKFAAGDTFSVRALADGTVEVYRNGKLLAKRDVTP